MHVCKKAVRDCVYTVQSMSGLSVPISRLEKQLVAIHYTMMTTRTLGLAPALRQFAGVSRKGLFCFLVYFHCIWLCFNYEKNNKVGARPLQLVPRPNFAVSRRFVNSLQWCFFLQLIFFLFIYDRSLKTESLPPSDRILNNQRLRRPSSPHFTIYQPQLTWLGSIANRITGCALSVCTRTTAFYGYSTP